jgi:hypothetical protein
MTPPGKRCDQQAHGSRHDQQSLHYAQTTFCVCIPQNQQSKLFAPHIAYRSLKLLVQHVVRPALDGVGYLVKIVGTLATDDGLSARDFLGHKPLEACQLGLLNQVICCQFTKSCLVLLNRLQAGAVGLKIRTLARQPIFPGARIHSVRCQQ